MSWELTLESGGVGGLGVTPFRSATVLSLCDRFFFVEVSGQEADHFVMTEFFGTPSRLRM